MNKQNSRKSNNKNQHERSLDDFLKQIRKCNLKSERHQRYLSPKPLLYMYGDRKNPNTMQTLERSRTLSNKQSLSKKTSKSLRKRVQKILSTDRKSNIKSGIKIVEPQKDNFENPGDKIQLFTKRIRQAEKFLENKSKLGTLLCQKFLEMLNQIVQNMIKNLQDNLLELQSNISNRLQKEINEKTQKQMKKMKIQLQKMQKKTLELLQKENYNANLIYYLRLKNIDIDKEFGRCFFDSDDYGGRGYHQDQRSLPIQDQSHDSYRFQKPMKKQRAYPDRKAEAEDDQGFLRDMKAQRHFPFHHPQLIQFQQQILAQQRDSFRAKHKKQITN